MVPKKSKYAVRKYNGDDIYSWAVFYAADVKGKRGVIFMGDARPIASGCSRGEAESIKKQFENR